MTNDTAQNIGRLIGVLITLCVNVYAGYLVGHMFHSFVFGYITYAVLSSLDAISLRLGRLTEGK